MKDFAISDNPAVQRQLDRLGHLPLPQGKFGLETIREILDRLGNPQRALPPVFHVAGTNGKGSTCAFLRAMLEAQGRKVHVATKPHLVRYNERIRIAGELIEDALLAALLEEVLDASEDLSPSFFEVTTAAAFLAFHRNPADASVIEVGLGGRFDATNVLDTPAVCGIAALGIDHEEFLLTEDPTAPSPAQPLVRIAFEKAGIARAGAPLVTQEYAPEVAAQIAKSAAQSGAPLHIRGRNWHADIDSAGIAYRDDKGQLELPLPSMPGMHQAENAVLAVAMIRHQDRLPVSGAALATGIRSARWPARLQVLAEGPVTEHAPGRPFILDGGHNPNAAEALAHHLQQVPQPVDAIIGMMAAKDARRFLGVLAPHLASVIAVPIEGHDHLATGEIEDFARAAGVPHATSAPDLKTALATLPTGSGSGTVLIAGSLYLAGKVLSANREYPD